MLKTMCSANPHGVARPSLVVLAGATVGLFWLAAACEQVFAQAAPPASKPATPVPGPKAAATPAAPPQVAQPAKKVATPAKTTKAEPKEEPPPAPESSFLRTKDGWSIFYTFYGPKAGVRPGKAVVPIIMLHGWQGQGSEYADFAVLLQSWGFATIVPDLRGHGRSLNVLRRDRRGEDRDEVVKADDLTLADLEGMVNDVEAIKRVLMDKHNKGELNIEMLTVIAADVGTIVALNWSALDWSWPITTAGKQGQDVKALVLLSPQQTFKRLNAAEALRHQAVTRRLSILIAAGDQQAREFSEAKRIHTRLERGRPAVAPEERMQKQDLFLIQAPTPLQGTKLLDRALPVAGSIMRFIELRLLRRMEDFPWAERRSPLGGS